MTGLRIEQNGASFVITLDRPARLNAIDTAMRAKLTTSLPAIAREPNCYGLIWRAAPGRMFSAGGDIRELLQQVEREPAAACAALAHEYALIWLLECFSKPTVALMNGAVIGGGAGLTMVATHRVAGEGYRFQMPETAIGFFPDDGLAATFARLPGEIGVYLGLTGRSIERADAYRLGLVTHCLPAALFDVVETEFADAEPVDPVLDSRHEHPGPAPIDEVAATIARCFSAATIEDIIERLHGETEHRAWAADVATELGRRSPTALKATLAHIRAARTLDLRLTLMRDHRLACRMVAAPDFREGVEALFAKRTPRWSPASLAEVSEEAVGRLGEPLPGTALSLATRQEMQAARV